MPVLAAEQRLELLVEYAAALAQAESLEALDQISASMLRRALSADVVCVLDRLDESVRALDPADAELWLESEALVAAQSGGVVPTLASDGRAALTSALRVDGVAEAYVHAQFLKADPKIKSELAELMHAFTRLAGLSAGNVLRRAANERIARLQLDLTQARAVQARVQPAPVGERAAIRYAMHLHPGRLVAGDLCDVLDLDAERTVILLGDVAGAGVGAGFLMAAALAHLRASLEHTGSIEAAASSLNRFVAGIGGGQFVTLFMAECQRTSRSVRVIDAGHGHVRVIAPEGLRAVSLRGSVPLGVDAGASFQVEHLSLRSDERLLIYSDGVAELRNGQGETFGAAQLEAILKRSHDVETDISLTCAGLELFAGHVPEDDATLLSVAWRSS
jgi:serine phosphatase RsbU (regulator of sigma subunit)